jgi:hypothetical protein
MVERLMSSYQVKQCPEMSSCQEENRRKLLDAKSCPTGMFHNFPTEILKQVPCQLCRVVPEIVMEENYTIAKKTRAFLLMALTRFSPWRSTFRY